jgi:Fe-Mn family superoxide dismutase
MSHCTRREILQAAGAGVATLALAPLAALAADEKPGNYTLPKLPYAYDALEPHIDAETMKIHHDKHHQAYIDNTIKFLSKGAPKLLEMPVDQLLADPKQIPDKIRTPVMNNAGGHSNHTIFWEVMGPKAGGHPEGELAKQIDKRFGSFDKFQKLFSDAATNQFGSGWAWLVVNKKGDLQVVPKPNQNSPITDGSKPLLGIDVWEHAYYLKYRNLRAAYIKAWWNVVNWKEVSERAAKAHKA